MELQALISLFVFDWIWTLGTFPRSFFERADMVKKQPSPRRNLDLNSQDK